MTNHDPILSAEDVHSLFKVFREANKCTSKTVCEKVEGIFRPYIRDAAKSDIQRDRRTYNRRTVINMRGRRLGGMIGRRVK